MEQAGNRPGVNVTPLDPWEDDDVGVEEEVDDVQQACPSTGLGLTPGPGQRSTSRQFRTMFPPDATALILE